VRRTGRVLGLASVLGAIGAALACGNSTSSTPTSVAPPDAGVDALSVDAPPDDYAPPPSCAPYCEGLEGCSVVVCDDDGLVPGLYGFAITSQQIYWINDVGEIRTANLDGTNPRALLTLSVAYGPAFAATDADLFYSLWAYPPGEIHAIDLGTLQDSVLATNTTARFIAIGLDQTLLASEVDLNQIAAFALDGGTTVLAGPSQGVIVPSGVAQSGQALYWGSASPDGGGINEMPAGAEAGTPLVTSVVFDAVKSIAIDSTGVYWCEDGEVLRADLSGANVTRVVPLGAFKTDIDRIAVDANYVYVMYGSAILRIPKPQP
jgi:hypothetical protein